MPLDVWIGTPSSLKGSPGVSFEPEEYYNFLYDLFVEYSKTSGKMIDPYDDAIFKTSELDSVLALVDKAKKLISEQPTDVVVFMGTDLGTRIEPKNVPMYSSVNRDDYLRFIKNLRDTVVEAKKLGKDLVFFGD